MKKNKVQRVIENANWVIKNFIKITPSSVLVDRPTYKSDGLFIQNNIDCLTEPHFKRAYDLSLTVNDWRTELNMDMRWRFYIVCYFANRAKNLDGDFVECGVYKGGYSLAIADYLNFGDLNKQFWLLDTFEGLVKDYITEEEKKAGLFEFYEGRYEDCYEAVKTTFASYKNYNIIKGAVPDTLPLCKAEKIAYLSIDMNCVEPEIQAANYFWDKLVSGAVVILDDYGFSTHIEQKLAFDIFAKERNVQILSLPTGQAIIFKP